MSAPAGYYVSLPRLGRSTGTFSVGIGFSDDANSNFDLLVPFNGPPWPGCTISTLATIAGADTLQLDVYDVLRNESPAGVSWAAVLADVPIATASYTVADSGVFQMMKFASTPDPVAAGTTRIVSSVPREWAIVYTTTAAGTLASRGTIQPTGGLMGGTHI